jgi:hypothetical protein
MSTGLGVFNKGDLGDIFNPRTSPKRANVNIKASNGLDLSELFEPSNDYDQINFDTGYISDGQDLRFLFQRKGYLPTYYITPTLTLVSEGDTIIFNITTTDVPPNTVVCYDTSSNSDFESPTGTVTINSEGIASFSLTLKNDLTTEGTEKITVRLKDCASDKILVTSEEITIRDTSRTPPTYALTTTSVTVNEGDTVTFQVVTTDVDDGEVLYYSTSSDSDFVTPTGSVIITSNRGSFNLVVKNDRFTEGTETFTALLRTGSTSGTVVATSPVVTIRDTSKTPPTYQITPNKTTVGEGETVTFTVITTDVDDNTVLYYTISLASDVTPSSGSITIKNNTALFTVTVSEDMLSEGRETFTASLKTGSTTGTTVRTSASIDIITDCFKGSSKLSEITTNPLSLTPVSFGNFGAGRYVIEYVSGAYSQWASGDRWLVGQFTLKAGTTTSTIGDNNVYTESVVESKGREWNNRFNVFTHPGGDISLTILDNPVTDNRNHPGYGAPKYAIYDYTCGNPPTYSITSDKAVVSEGDTIKATVNTTGVPNGTVLYYNTTSDSDFDTPSGSVTINNNTGTFNLTVKRDAIYETTETFVINLRRGSTSGFIAATSSSITINTTPPTYAISANKSSVTEGGTVIFTVTTTDVANGTKLYYTTSSNNDFNNPTGEITINNNTGTFTLNVKNDLVFEGAETFTVDLKTGSIAGTTVRTSGSITILDAPPVYTIVPNKASVVEGGTVIYTVITTDVADGTKLYYVASLSNDFVTPSGEITINSNTASFTLTVKSDVVYEGVETFTVDLKTGSITGTTVKTSTSVAISDAAATYAIAANKTAVDEGQTITFTVTTTNVADGTKLYLKTSSDSDFNTYTNEVTVNSNTATLTLTVKNDIATEGEETFTVDVRTGSVTGTLQVLSDTVQIRDTSRTPTYAIGAPTSVNEGDIVTFTVNTTNVVAGTVLYYDVENVTTTSNDFTGATSGSVTIGSDGKASFNISIKSDLETEGTQSFKTRLRTDSASGSVVRTSSSVDINDTSKYVSTYTISSDKTSVNEGGSVTFTITTTYVDNGTPLYYEVVNTSTNSNDFTGNVSGSITVNSNSASFTINIKNDLTTEGAESFTVRVRKDSTTGSVVATSGTININDTSTSAPTYTITPNKNTVVEDEIVTFDVTTTNVPDGTTLYYSIPGVSNMLASDTDININIDNTSLEAATQATIKEMVSYGVLRRMLLPYYNNDATLFDQRVQVFLAMGAKRDERTFGVNHLRRPGRSGSRLVNITFQDETDINDGQPAYGNTNNANYNADVTALRADLEANPGKRYGIVFQVEGYAKFKTFLQQVKAGTGNFTSLNLKDKSEIVFYYDFPGGAKTTQLTYATKIIETFKTLGLITDNVFTVSDVDKVSGSLTINGGKGSFTIKATKDLLAENNESFSMDLLTGSTRGTVVKTSSSVTIVDSDCRKGAKLAELVTAPKTANKTALPSTVNFTTGSLSPGWYIIEYVSGAHSHWSTGDKWLINGFKVMSGTKHIATLERDFTSASQTSIEDIGKNWFGLGRPYYKVVQHTGGTLGLLIDDNPVYDNRIHPNGATKYALYEYVCQTPTYKITAPAEINEGDTLTFTVDTTNIPNGAQLFFDVEGKATRATGDLVATTTTNLNGGALTIQNNTATVNAFVVVADEATEGDETFNIVLRSGFDNGPVVARSSVITIKDTSKKPTYSIQPNVSEIDEGGEVTFNISTTNIANGTQLTYSLSRTDVTPSTGTITITDNKGSFKVTASSDKTTEGYTTFKGTLKRGSDIVATSNDVGIKDTSTGSTQYTAKFTLGHFWDTGTGGEGEDSDTDLIGNTPGTNYEYYIYGTVVGWRGTDTKTYTRSFDNESTPFTYNTYSKYARCGSPSQRKAFYLSDISWIAGNNSLTINYIKVKNKATGKTQDIGVGISFWRNYANTGGGIYTGQPTRTSAPTATARFIKYNPKGCSWGGWWYHWEFELDLNITI